MGAKLEIRDLSKRFGTVQAVSGVSLTVEPGQIVGLLGPNGAGKTTTMSCVVGLLRPDHGSVTIDGHPAGSPAAQSAVGFVPEEPILFPELTVLEHMGFIARAYRLTDWSEVAHGLLEAFDLWEHRDKTTLGLSQGMSRKTALAMALLHDSGLVILDEPFNGLDPAGQHELRSRIEELRQRGLAVMVSTHRLAEIERLADRFTVLRQGEVVASGTVDDLRLVSGSGPDADLEDVYLALTS